MDAISRCRVDRVLPFANLRLVVISGLLASAAPAVRAADLGAISDPEIDQAVAAVATSDTEQRTVRTRLKAWKELLESARNRQLAPPDKLRAVNDFMNETPFFCDPVIWCMEDFWAKPVEFLANDMGDCEDFAIAKFYTLKALGADENKLKIVYAVYRSGSFTGAHMVLAYYPEPESEPLILDNINPDVLPASRRPDLVPVFSFNTQGAWGAQEQKGRGSQPGSQYPAWSEQWRRVQTDQVVRSVSPEQRKSAACQALIQRSVWCR